MPNLRPRSVVLIGLAAWVLAGCGGSDGSGFDATVLADTTSLDTASPADATGDSIPYAGPFLVRETSKNWKVTTTVKVQNANATLTRLTVIVPTPQTNIYQEVTNLQFGAATLLAIPESDDFYLRFSDTSGLPGPGASTTYAITYDVTLYDLHVDLSQVTTIHPYDTSAPEYSMYTGPRDVYIDPDNATIVSISDTLAAGAPDILSYAKAAYEYVGSHYQYLNPNTGLHPLADILAAGGGDCGNLTSIYVSLLRHRGIPARHLVTIRPDGTYHVWADFLLQGYGWVPVDVTYKQSNPAGDYFGKVALGSNGIIMDEQIWLTLDKGDGTFQIPLLQNYAWWYWSSTPSPSITPSFSLVSVPK